MSSTIYHYAIATVLAQSAYRNQDVRVYIDTVPCGIWLWEENSKTHIHFDCAELVEFLGVSDELLEYMNSRPTMETSWRFINPNRLRAALR